MIVPVRIEPITNDWRTVEQVAGIGRCSDLEEAVVAAADAVDRRRRARDVASEALELPSILRGERLSGKNGEPGMP
jgi:hypothetical protein